MTKALVNAFVIGMAASIPALCLAAWYFQNAKLLFWIALPVIFFMAG